MSYLSFSLFVLDTVLMVNKRKRKKTC